MKRWFLSFFLPVSFVGCCAAGSVPPRSVPPNSAPPKLVPYTGFNEHAKGVPELREDDVDAIQFFLGASFSLVRKLDDVDMVAFAGNQKKFLSGVWLDINRFHYLTRGVRDEKTVWRKITHNHPPDLSVDFGEGISLTFAPRNLVIEEIGTFLRTPLFPTTDEDIAEKLTNERKAELRQEIEHVAPRDNRYKDNMYILKPDGIIDRWKTIAPKGRPFVWGVAFIPDRYNPTGLIFEIQQDNDELFWPHLRYDPWLYDQEVWEKSEEHAIPGQWQTKQRTAPSLER